MIENGDLTDCFFFCDKICGFLLFGEDISNYFYDDFWNFINTGSIEYVRNGSYRLITTAEGFWDFWSRAEERKMWFKNTYQARQIKDTNNYEIVKWDEKHQSCFVIAFLQWNEHEPAYDLRSVGMRLVKYGECLEWIGTVAEYLEKTNNLERED